MPTSSDNATLFEISMARQPIYDRGLAIYGFELLYRGSQSTPGVLDGTESARAILNALVGFGISELAGSKPAFINLSEELIVNGQVDLLPKESVVLEVLETVKPTAAVVQILRDLRESGYKIAIDDFVAGDGRDELLSIADIVKIDVLAHTTATELQRQVRLCARPGRQLLAEKVEDYKSLRLCRSLGFDFFQGYFLCQPDVLRAREVRANRATLLALLQKLQDPAVRYSDLEEIVNHDLGMAHRLLRFIRSAHLGLEAPIASIRQALLFLGVRRVAALGCLMAMAEKSEKPSHLLRMAIERAKMCELLAVAANEVQQERFFTVGLFSVLDALMDSPMEKVLSDLPLEAETKGALMGTDTESPLYLALNCVRNLERGNFSDAKFRHLTGVDISAAYRLAVAWAVETEFESAA